jgi:flagellar biosynthetic protein FlhB
MLQPLEASMDDFASLVLLATLLIVASLALIAAIDVPYQLWEYHRKLRMSKEEVRQEMKEQEGIRRSRRASVPPSGRCPAAA